MQESYEEGLASRLGPESYADGGNIVGVATALVRAGQPLSSENITSVGRPCSDMGKATSSVALLASHDGAAAVWFRAVAWLVVRTNNVWDCVTANGVTNLLRGIYLMAMDDWWLM